MHSSKSTRHSYCWSGASRIVQTFNGLLRPEDIAPAHEEVYQQLDQILAEYEQAMRKLWHRLNPSGNRSEGALCGIS